MTTLVTLEARRTGYGLRQAVRAEALKLATLRSTLWTIAATVLGVALVTVLVTNSASHHPRNWYGGWWDPTNEALGGLIIATLSIGFLGVLVASGEYGTGTIRSSLAAIPRRPVLLGAKAAVVGGLTLALGEVLAFACFGIGQAVLAAGGAPTASLGQTGVLRAVLLSGVFLSMLALLGLGIGVVVRHTAGALATYAGVTFLVPLLLSRVGGNPGRYTPVPLLNNSIGAVVNQPDQVPVLLAVALMTGYCAVALALAAASILRRDA